MHQSSHTSNAGVKNISLLLIAEPSGPEIITIGGSKPFGRPGVSYDYTTIKLPKIHSNQSTATIYRRGNGDSECLPLHSGESS